MKYTVYTDGAGSELDNVIGCSYIILTKDKYVWSDFVRVEGMSNPTQAETIAVGLASAYLLDNKMLTKKDEIEFNIDCLSTIIYYKYFVLGIIDKRLDKDDIKIGPPNKQVKVATNIAKSLNKKSKVRLQKCKGHKSVLNPNDYVDQLAKMAIRK